MKYKKTDSSTQWRIHFEEKIYPLRKINLKRKLKMKKLIC